MNYPLISDYIEAIKSSENNFKELTNLRPVLGDDGLPVMSSGNFAVVFKMKDEQTGRLHAVKCFLKEQEGRAEAYRMIAEELEYVSSTFLTPIRYLDKELFVDTKASDETEFPVLLMDWVEGKTLDKYIREHIDDQYELSLLAYQFSRLAMWLMPQPFAHGDLKPDNILVKDDGTLVLVDYDGMFVPAMKGQKARELGSPDFRHPSRTEDVFDEHIDDFSLVSILLSLKAISLKPELLEQYGAADRLLFSVNDYQNLSDSYVVNDLRTMMQDTELATLMSLFILTVAQNNLSQVSFRLFNLSKPQKQEMSDEEMEARFRMWEEEMAPYDVEESWTFVEFVKKFALVRFQQGSAYYSVTDGGEDAFFFLSKNGEEITVFNQSGLTKDNLLQEKDNLIVELRKSGHYILYFSSENRNTTNDEKKSYNEMTEENIYDIIKVCASQIMTSIKDEVKEELDTKLSSIELTMLSAASVLEMLNAKNDNWQNFIEQKIFNEYVSIKDIEDYDSWIESNTPGLYINDVYIISDGTSLEEFEKVNGPVHFFSGKINAYPYDERLWGEFVDNNGKKQIIYVDQGFPSDYSISEVLNDKQAFAVVEEKDTYYGGDDIVYCLKKIKKEHSMLPDYISERLSFYAKATYDVMSNRNNKKAYAFQLYNAVINDRLNYNAPYLGVEDLEFDDDTIVDCQTGEQYHCNVASLDNFTKCIDEVLSNLRNELNVNNPERNLSTEVSDEDLANAWTDEYGVKYSANGKRLLKGVNVEEYNVLDGVQVICDSAFVDCNKIESIIFPDSVIEIGEFAFRNCI